MLRGNSAQSSRLLSHGFYWGPTANCKFLHSSVGWKSRSFTRSIEVCSIEKLIPDWNPEPPIGTRGITATVFTPCHLLLITGTWGHETISFASYGWVHASSNGIQSPRFVIVIHYVHVTKSSPDMITIIFIFQFNCCC